MSFIPHRNWFFFVFITSCMNLNTSEAFSSHRFYSSPTFSIRFTAARKESHGQINQPNIAWFRSAIYSGSSQEPHHLSQKINPSMDIIHGDDGATPYYLVEVPSPSDQDVSTITVHNDSSSFYHGDSNLTLSLLNKGGHWITAVVGPIFDRNVQKGVQWETLKGAALAGLGLSAFVGKSLATCGVMSVGAMYIAVTPGKAGDFIRSVGSATWNSTEYVMRLLSSSIPRMAHHTLSDANKHVNTTLEEMNTSNEPSTFLHNSKERKDVSKNVNAEKGEILGEKEKIALDEEVPKKFGVDDTKIFVYDSSQNSRINNTLLQDGVTASAIHHDRIIETNESKYTDSIFSAQELLSDTVVPSTISIDSTDRSSPSHVLSETSIPLVSLTDSAVNVQEPITPSISQQSTETESFEISIKLKKKGNRIPKDSDMNLQRSTDNVSQSTVELSKKSKKQRIKSKLDPSTDNDDILATNRDNQVEHIGTSSNRIHYDKLTVPEIKEKLRSLGLKVTGVKAELLNRLYEYEGQNDR